MTVHTMSDIELDRLDTIKQLIDRQQAADIFGLTARHINRLSKAYKNDGVDGRISKRRGKQPRGIASSAHLLVLASYHAASPNISIKTSGRWIAICIKRCAA